MTDQIVPEQVDRPMTYAPAGLTYAAVDQHDVWLLRFSDQDCGDQWFGGECWMPEEARDAAIEAHKESRHGDA